MNNIYIKNDSKFKSIRISINYTFNTFSQDISKNALVAFILSKGCSKFKTEKEIENYMSELYGSKFDINVEKVGDLYNLEFVIEFISKNFLPNNVDIMDNCIDFIYDIIYNPKLDNGLFDNEIFKIEKSNLINKIESRKDEKLKYAVQRTEEILTKDSSFGTYIYGTVENVEKISNKDTFDRYLWITSNSYINIIVVGNLDNYNNIEEKLYNKFGESIQKNIDYKELNFNNNNSSCDSINEIKEKMITNQSVITVGLRIKDTSINDFIVFNLYNCILGVSASSKLFLNFREKESLGYTIKSRYYRFKDIIVIYAGIEKDNYEKAKKVIFSQIENMKNNISTNELKSAKEYLINDLKEWNDSKIALSKHIYTNIITTNFDEISIESIIENINKVTIEDIIKMSSKINIELVYLLGGDN